MNINTSNFDSISEEHIHELITNGVPESLIIEYKRELYGRSDAQKDEALKDISAFANSHGGHLILGVTENNGVPVSLNGIDVDDPDHEVNTLHQIIQTGVEPTIIGLQIKFITLNNNNNVFVIRVPTSINPPHRVIARGKNKFFIRNSNGVHEASMMELKNLFNLHSDAKKELEEFKSNRINKIINQDGSRPLVGEGRLIIHLFPLSSLIMNQPTDLSVFHSNHQLFRPIAAEGFSPEFNFEGFINERRGENNHGYTQVFRNGIIEATYAPIIRERGNYRFIPGLALNDKIIEVIPGYINGLINSGYFPPITISITIEGANNITLSLNDEGTGRPIDRNIMQLPDCTIYKIGNNKDYIMALKPAFDALWNQVGRAQSLYFNQDGEWVGPNIRQ